MSFLGVTYRQIDFAQLFSRVVVCESKLDRIFYLYIYIYIFFFFAFCCLPEIFVLSPERNGKSIFLLDTFTSRVLSVIWQVQKQD